MQREVDRRQRCAACHNPKHRHQREETATYPPPQHHLLFSTQSSLLATRSSSLRPYLRRPARSAPLARPPGWPTAARRLSEIDGHHLVAHLPKRAVQRQDQLPLFFPDHPLLEQQVFKRLHQRFRFRIHHSRRHSRRLTFPGRHHPEIRGSLSRFLRLSPATSRYPVGRSAPTREWTDRRWSDYEQKLVKE